MGWGNLITCYFLVVGKAKSVWGIFGRDCGVGFNLNGYEENVGQGKRKRDTCWLLTAT